MRLPAALALAMAQPGEAKRSAIGSEAGPCKKQKGLLCQEEGQTAASEPSVEEKDSVSTGLVRAEVDGALVKASLTEADEDKVWSGFSEWCETQPGFANPDLDLCSQSQIEPVCAGSKTAASQPGLSGPHVLENDRLDGSDGSDKSGCSDTDSQVTLDIAFEANPAHPITAVSDDTVQDDLLETLGWAEDRSIPRFRGEHALAGNWAHLRLYDHAKVVDQTTLTFWKGSVRAWVSNSILESGSAAAFETDRGKRSEQFLGWAAAFWFEEIRGRWSTWSVARRRDALSCVSGIGLRPKARARFHFCFSRAWQTPKCWTHCHCRLPPCQAQCQ